MYHLERACEAVGIDLKFLVMSVEKARDTHLAVEKAKFEKKENRKDRAQRRKFDEAEVDLSFYENLDKDQDKIVYGFTLNFEGLRPALASEPHVFCIDFCHTKAGCLGGSVKLDGNHQQVVAAYAGFDGMNESNVTWNVLTQTLLRFLGDDVNNEQTTMILDEAIAGLACSKRWLRFVRLFRCLRHRLMTVSNGGPPGTAEAYSKAASAKTLGRLLAAKESMTPFLRRKVDNVPDAELFPAANKRQMYGQATTNPIESHWA
ncbi:MAG: hypothetical protein AAGA95_20520, partial [Pseudomonadota bacterium]